MKNYFVIHALGRTENDYWYKFIKRKVEDKGYQCFVPTLPPIEDMSYDSWQREFDKYKQYINKDSIVIGHSTGSVFLVKYLMKNHLKVEKFIGVVSFNNKNKYAVKPEWDKINESFFVPNLKDFINYANERVCFYSPTDIFDFESLDLFATTIEAKKIIIENAGHFTKGYIGKFDKILEYL